MVKQIKGLEIFNTDSEYQQSSEVLSSLTTLTKSQMEYQQRLTLALLQQPSVPASSANETQEIEQHPHSNPKNLILDEQRPK